MTQCLFYVRDRWGNTIVRFQIKPRSVDISLREMERKNRQNAYNCFHKFSLVWLAIGAAICVCLCVKQIRAIVKKPKEQHQHKLGVHSVKNKLENETSNDVLVKNVLFTFRCIYMSSIHA